jgi:peptide/nickel transport system substrate-binding protein
MGRKKARDEEGFRKFEEFLGEWSRRDFLRKTGATVAWAAFMGGTLDLLEACGNATSTTTSSPAAKKGGHMVEGQFTDLKNLNPVLVSDTYSSTLSGQLYEPLLVSKGNGDLLPALAKEMPKQSADGTTYTFTLRDNVTFTDGSKITADDVKFTYDLMFDPQYKDVNSPRRGDLEQYLASIKVVDPKTIVFTTKKVYAPFLVSHCQYGILPKAVWSKLAPKEINTTEFNNLPTVTSGPYKPVKWDKGQQYVLTKNDKYWQGPPNIDNWVFKVLPDSVTLSNQLKTGEVDFGPVDPTQLSNVQASADVDIHTFPLPSFVFYEYNLDPAKAPSKMFGDKAVRQALFYGLNRQAMADAIYFKQAVVANTSMPPVSWAYNKDTKPQYPYDKAKAESILETAGWKKGSDGIRANGATKLKFTMLTNAGNKVRENLLIEMQQRWKDIGVDATPQFIPFPELVAQIQNKRTFEVLLVGFNWSADPDQSQVWGSASAIPGGFNGMLYKNPTLDKILDDATATLDRAKRKDLYFQMQNIINEDLPAPILVFSKGIYGINKRVQGVKGGDLGLNTYTQYSSRPWMRTMFVTDGK